MSSFAHLGQLMAAYATAKNLTAADAAGIADVTTTTWLTFEKTGEGLGPHRIGLVAEALGITKEALFQLDDPLSVLSTVWSVELGELVRERRAHATTAELGARVGASSASIIRWERAQTRPRDRAQLTRLLDTLGVEPLAALAHALWPPKAVMADRSNLGVALLAKRQALGLSTRQVAEQLSVAQGAYNAWERGRCNPTARFRATLAGFLGVGIADVEALLGPEHVDTFGLDATAKLLVKQRRGALERRKVAADRSGLTESQLRGYEHGRRRPTVTSLPKYAAAFHLDPFEVALLQLGVTRDQATFGQLIAAARLAHGLTLRGGASRLGTNHATLNYWEADRNLPVTAARHEAMVTAVVGAYGLTTDEVRAALARTAPVVDPFGSWLKAAIAASGCTQAGLARRLGVPKPAVHNWSSGRCRPGRRFAPQLSAALGVAETEILSRLDQPRVRIAA